MFFEPFVLADCWVWGGFSFSKDISRRFELTSPRYHIICLVSLYFMKLIYNTWLQIQD